MPGWYGCASSGGSGPGVVAADPLAVATVAGTAPAPGMAAAVVEEQPAASGAFAAAQVGRQCRVAEQVEPGDGEPAREILRRLYRYRPAQRQRPLRRCVPYRVGQGRRRPRQGGG